MAMMEDEGGTAEDLLTAISCSGLHGCGNFGVDVPLHLRLPDALTRQHRSRDAYHYWHVFASDSETEVMSVDSREVSVHVVDVRACASASKVPMEPPRPDAPVDLMQDTPVDSMEDENDTSVCGRGARQHVDSEIEEQDGPGCDPSLAHTPRKRRVPHGPAHTCFHQDAGEGMSKRIKVRVEG